MIISYDEELVAKDAEIAKLKGKLSAAPGTHCRGDHADLVTASSDSLPRTTCGASDSRRGKAPLVDPFSGDDGVTRFDDWLPSLERASSWNAWTDEEKLLQLAGHLRGRALQEWNLIPTDDRSTFADAVMSLRSRVDHKNPALSGQDFRHATQEMGESVAEYIRRLERLFQAAYGHDGLSVEIRQTLLYSQLQEGLKYGLIKSPAVSGAYSYTQLCIAARHEEKRLNELSAVPQGRWQQGRCWRQTQRTHQVRSAEKIGENLVSATSVVKLTILRREKV